MTKPKRMRWAEQVSHIRAMRNVYKVLVRKAVERKSPLGRYRHRWEDNIKIDLMKQCWRVWTQFI
jgi:hypothetical protein